MLQAHRLRISKAAEIRSGECGTLGGIKVLAVGKHCTSIDTSPSDWQGPQPGYTMSPEHLATDERTTFAHKTFYVS